MKNICLLLGLLPLLPIMAENDYSFVSPSKNLVLTYREPSADHPFTLQLANSTIANLDFGLQLKEDIFSPISAAKTKIKNKKSNADYNEYLLSKKDSKIFLRFRVFDKALAYRYEAENKIPWHLDHESSSWTMSPDTKIWYFERKNAWKLKSYAGTWENTLLGDLNKVSSPVQGTPIVFQLSGGQYGFISEAALKDYSGMRLRVEGNTLSADFTEGKKGFDLPKHFCSPWRIFYVGNTLNDLVNQNVIEALNIEPDRKQYGDRSYIQPGKSVWRWFARGTGNPEQEREMIDAAAQLNFSYTTVDDGWKRWADKWEKVKDLVAYGKSKGVKVFLWFNSSPFQNTENDYAYMRTMLDSVASSGVVGVKVDFMDSEAKRLIDFELRLLQECAKRRLLVNFHGCHKSTGESFTFPNEVTREGIRGLELNKMGEGYITATHNAALPFTRFVVGHADYTPLSFTVPGETTFAHQLATLVCFESFMQTIAEDPVILLHDPLIKPALNFIRNVPTVWDEIRVLPQSEIGKLAMIAKRSGKDWYIGILNGEAQSKTIHLDLGEIEGGNALVEGYVDDLEAPKVLLSMKGQRPAVLKRIPSVPFKVETHKKNLQTMRLAPCGGAVVVIHNR